MVQDVQKSYEMASPKIQTLMVLKKRSPLND